MSVIIAARVHRLETTMQRRYLPLLNTGVLLRLDAQECITDILHINVARHTHGSIGWSQLLTINCTTDIFFHANAWTLSFALTCDDAEGQFMGYHLTSKAACASGDGSWEADGR